MITDRTIPQRLEDLERRLSAHGAHYEKTASLHKETNTHFEDGLSIQFLTFLSNQ